MGDTYICLYMEEGNIHTRIYVCGAFSSVEVSQMPQKLTELILETSLNLKDVSIYLNLLYKVQSL